MGKWEKGANGQRDITTKGKKDKNNKGHWEHGTKIQRYKVTMGQ
jgi:hypothetical protein